MRLFTVFTLATLLAAMSSFDDAEARRGGFSFNGSRAKTRSLPIIIPISSSSSSVVFVKELPDTAAFKFQDEGFYDLGYRFDTLGGGEWVGYFKSKSSYVELDQAKVREFLLPAVGLTEADAPTRGAGGQFMVGFAWIIAALGVVGLLLLRAQGLRRALFAPRARKETTADVSELHFATDGAPPFLQQKPNVAAVNSSRSSFSRAAPANAFGKRR